jgi:RHS repeat-associated protein
MCDGPGWESWSYNQTGHLLDDRRSTSSLVKDTLYAPNLDGSDASITYPITNRVITYTPGQAGLPLSASDGTTNYATAAHYTPQGALASLTNNGNIYSTFIYNSRLQPCWIYATTSTMLAASTLCTANDSTPGTIIDLKYNFNLGAGDNGNVVGITNNRDSTRSQVFSYDSLNRIATAGTVNTSGTNCWGETYGIDAWANLYSLALPSSYSSSCAHETPFSYTIPNSNQLPSSSGFTFDAAGNLMASGLGNYVYNAEHQMTSVTVASTTTTYSYDGDGKRVEKSGGKIYWYGGGSDTLDETDLTGNTNNATFSEYVFFGGKRVARRDYQSNIYYYFADHLGTSREMVEAGQTTPCYDADFYPYGGENAHTTTCTQNYKFTSKERDSESGLDNFGARYMASSFGRFMSPDWTARATAVPYAEFRDPQTLNLYGYVRNGPTMLRDRDGHCAFFGLDTIVCAAAVAAIVTVGVALTVHQLSKWAKEREEAEKKAFEKSYNCAMNSNSTCTERELRGYDKERVNTYVDGAIEGIKLAVPSAEPATTVPEFVADQAKDYVIDTVVKVQKKEALDKAARKDNDKCVGCKPPPPPPPEQKVQ